MHGLKPGLTGGLLVTAVWFTQAAAQRPATSVTVMLFEGARLINGNGGAPIDNSAFLVENHTFTRVGRKQHSKTAVLSAFRGFLDDITNTRKISRVYLRGVEIDRAKLTAGFMNPGTAN